MPYKIILKCFWLKRIHTNLALPHWWVYAGELLTPLTVFVNLWSHFPRIEPTKYYRMLTHPSWQWYSAKSVEATDCSLLDSVWKVFCCEIGEFEWNIASVLLDHFFPYKNEICYLPPSMVARIKCLLKVANSSGNNSWWI